MWAGLPADQTPAEVPVVYGPWSVMHELFYVIYWPTQQQRETKIASKETELLYDLVAYLGVAYDIEAHGLLNAAGLALCGKRQL